MAIDKGMTIRARDKAKLHVYNVCKQGPVVTFLKQATKDEFGTHLTETEITLNAFPVRLSPYERKAVENISWAEETDILCYFSKLEIENVFGSTNQFKSRFKKFRYDKKEYEIRYVEPYNSFADDFLYIIVGGKK